MRRQRLNVDLVGLACGLLLGTGLADQHAAHAAAVQLLPAIALSGYGLPLQAYATAAAACSTPSDALQALQRTDLDLCRVSCLRWHC